VLPYIVSFRKLARSHVAEVSILFLVNLCSNQNTPDRVMYYWGIIPLSREVTYKVPNAANVSGVMLSFFRFIDYYLAFLFFHGEVVFFSDIC
jgi:hypothetical protein